MLEVEAPARRLAAAMLAHDAVEPAFKTAGQVEISPVDRQHQRAIEHARIEPVGQDQLDPERPALRVEPFLPLVDPGETMAAALVLLADGCGDGRRLQPVERGFEAVSEEHTSELQSLMRISYAVFCLKKKTHKTVS